MKLGIRKPTTTRETVYFFLVLFIGLLLMKWIIEATILQTSRYSVCSSANKLCDRTREYEYIQNCISYVSAKDGMTMVICDPHQVYDLEEAKKGWEKGATKKVGF